MINYILLVMLLLVTITMVIEKNNTKLVIYFSVFSLIAASLYFYNHAPDVALAEIAVGSAFIPLIFLIAISKQRTFTIMVITDQPFIYIELFNDFCKKENLKLKVVNSEEVFDDEAKSIHGVFRRQDIDLILDYNPKKKRFDMTGKKSNVLIDKLEKESKKFPGMRIIRIEDKETID